MAEEEERKSAGNLNNYLEATGPASNEGLHPVNDTDQAYYNDLMDLIYTGDNQGSPDDGEPTVTILEDSHTLSSATEPKAIPFVTVASSDDDMAGAELEISTEAMELLDSM